MILVGIDGTGPEWVSADPQYEQDFADSHVNDLRKNWPDAVAYSRGPTLTGKECRALAEFGYAETIRLLSIHGQATSVFLAGYSRGGACVIETAKYLKQRKNQTVKCLILFDPVDRAFGLGGNVWQMFGDTPIPDTVENVIYAKRHPTARSRESFGNCGLTREDPAKTKLTWKQFFGTHGGLGGCPFKIPPGKTMSDFVNEGFPDYRTFVPYAQDLMTSNEVRRWTHEKLGVVLATMPEHQPITPQPPITIPVAPGIPNGGQQKIHIVQPGDWLSKIAITYYGDMNKWPAIYERNKQVIGPNPDLIQPGQKLVIP